MKINDYPKNIGSITEELNNKICPICGKFLNKVNIITPLGFSFVTERCSSKTCPTKGIN